MLEHNFSAIRNQLFSVIRQTPDQLPSYSVGAFTKSEQDAPPRIVWVPRGGRVTARGDQGGDGISNPSKLFQRNERCDAWIWAEDFEHCERLMNHLIAAIHVVMPGSWIPLSTNWDIGQENINRDGLLVVLAVELHIPFTREDDDTAVLEAIPIIPEVDPLVTH